MKILVVDDEPTIRDLFSEVLSDMEGVEVTCERSGFRAMTQVAEEHYDLLFTDIMMPGLNGLDTIDQVLGLQPDLRVIVITGFATDEILDQAAKRGAESTMKKPFGARDIIEAVQRVKAGLETGGD